MAMNWLKGLVAPTDGMVPQGQPNWQQRLRRSRIAERVP